MRQLITVAFLLLSLAAPRSAWASSTYYLSPTGSDSKGNGSSTQPWATLAKAFSTMTGGDTIVLKPGVYYGASNQFRYNNSPRSGTASAYSTVKAQEPGTVVLDGESALTMFDYYGTVAMHHVVIDGLQFVNPGPTYAHALTGRAHNDRSVQYVKILRCGFQKQFYVYYASYVLVEDCYVVGKGRYNFMTYVSDHIVFRRCIGRLDAATGGPLGHPISHFVNYASQYVEFQNCIAIDSDDTYYSNYEGIYGGFYVRCTHQVDTTTYVSSETKIRGSIVLNVHHARAGSSSPAEALSVGSGAYGTEIVDSVWWDIGRGMIIDNPPLTGSLTVNRSTFGRSLFSDWSDNSMIRGTDSLYGDVSNSIFYAITNPGTGIGYGVKGIRTSRSNDFFANEADKTLVGSTSGDLRIDPLSGTATLPAPLRYLVRVEKGSALSGAGVEASDIGANIEYQTGVSGTFWGEAGYQDRTATNLWPWPNEGLIRDFFRARGDATPAPDRGFCATGQTLTSYVWGYLGNTVPPIGLKAARAGSSSVLVSWDPPPAAVSVNAAGFNIYKMVNGSPVLLGTVGPETLSYSLTAVTTSMDLAVTALNSVSGESGRILVRVGPSAPRNVTIR
jgi:hypothetical protein